MKKLLATLAFLGLVVGASYGQVAISRGQNLVGAMLQFAGSTNAYPGLKRSGTALEVKLADDSGYATLNANTLTATNKFTMNGNVLVQITAPTIASGFGTSPAIVNTNGSAAFRVNVGTGGTASSGVITLPTAVNGWNCIANDLTTPATNLTRQSASTTTTATFTNYNVSGVATAWTASDVLTISCFGD